MKRLPLILLTALALAAQTSPDSPQKKARPNGPPPEAGDDVHGYNAVSYTHLTLPTTPYV